MRAFASDNDWSVMFTRDDGTQFEARHIATFTTEHPQFERNNYCALYSHDFNPGRDEPIVLFRVEVGENDEHTFFKVTNPTELQAMFEAWQTVIEAVQNNQVEGVNLDE
jgi:hypothetical protein